MNLRWQLARMRRMRPTEPMERLWWVARRAVSRTGTGEPGPALQPLPWGIAPPEDPAGVVRAIHDGPIPVLGHALPAHARRRWAHDPATGAPWPDEPAARLDLLDQPLDPRDAWEMGRLQHLALLAAADPTDPLPRDDARDFRAQHPPGAGLPWASTLEVALRLVSLAQIAAAWPEPDLLLAVAEHAQWLARFPSVGSAARNHRVAELAALAVAAWVLPDAVDRGGWARAAEDLPLVFDAQVHRDGVGVEQSTHYLAFVVEWGLVARSVGIPHLDGALVAAVRFLSTLIDATGSAVVLGDDDDGRVIAVHLGPEPAYVTSVVGAAAAVLGIPAPAAWRPDRRCMLLATEPTAPRADPGSHAFPEGGITVFRGGGQVVVVDHGPLGEPDLSAHGHADALSVRVHLPSGPAIVGRGTGRYHVDPAVRRFHRTSAAHPTVVVDGLSQSEPHEHPFLWRTRARTTLHELELERGHVVASHDGYRRALGIVHRRRVEHGHDELVLEDAIIGHGVHHVAVVLPLAPDLRAEHQDEAVEVVRDGIVVFTVIPDPRCDARLVRAGGLPGVGHHSLAYGRHVAATTVILEVRGRLPLELCTRIRFVPTNAAAGS